MNKKNIALIGYGYWGKKIYKYLQDSEEFNIRYVFFRSLKSLNRETITQQYGNEFVPTIDLLLDDVSVPNVIIATPIDSHYELTKQALMKSKNVLVEKPLATDPLHCEDLLNLAKGRNLKLETEYTYTYSESLLAARKMVEEGAIGELESIVLTKKQLGRFLSFDVYTLLGTHCLSMLDMFCPIKEYEFYPKPLMSHKGLTTAAIIYFESKNKKCRGYIDVSLHYPQRETKVTIFGQNGTIIYDPSANDTLVLTCYSRFQPKNENKVAVSRENVYTSDENHNLQRALKNFSNLLDKELPDNSRRAAEITEVLATFKNFPPAYRRMTT